MRASASSQPRPLRLLVDDDHQIATEYFAEPLDLNRLIDKYGERPA